MKSRIVTLFCALALVIWSGAAKAMEINVDYGNLTAPQRAVVDAVVAAWEAKLEQKPGKVTISFSHVALGPQDLTFGSEFILPDDPMIAAGDTVTLGVTDMFTEDPVTLKPVSARVRINTKVKFWEGVDPPPGGVWPNPSYDLFTVLKHEVAHAIGFSVNYTKFNRNVIAGPPRRYNLGLGAGNPTLTPAAQGTHLDPVAHPGDLMNPALPKCTRRTKSALDHQIMLDDLWNPKKGVYEVHFLCTGSQENPANGSTAIANVSLIIDTNNNQIHYNITHNVVNPTAGHIHGPANRDKNAGVVIGFPSVVSPMVGTLNYAGVEGTLEAPMLVGRTYVNIHSNAFPAGEIRGQIPTAPNVVPSLNEGGMIVLAFSLFAFGLYLVRRRRALA